MDFSRESSTLVQSTMLVHSMKTSPSSTMPASSIKPTKVTNGTPSVEDSEEVWQIAVYALVAALGKKSTFSKNP